MQHRVSCFQLQLPLSTQLKRLSTFSSFCDFAIWKMRVFIIEFDQKFHFWYYPVPLRSILCSSWKTSPPSIKGHVFAPVVMVQCALWSFRVRKRRCIYTYTSLVDQLIHFDIMMNPPMVGVLKWLFSRLWLIFLQGIHNLTAHCS